VNRTGLHRQVDAVQSLDTGELLGNALHAKQDICIVAQYFRLLILGISFHAPLQAKTISTDSMTMASACEQQVLHVGSRAEARLPGN
jgi:hypothetical protein